MSQAIEEEIKRWTAQRKSALVFEIIQGKTTVAEASRQFDLKPSEIENWVDNGKRGMENAARGCARAVRAPAQGPAGSLWRGGADRAVRRRRYDFRLCSGHVDADGKAGVDQFIEQFRGERHAQHGFAD